MADMIHLHPESQARIQTFREKGGLHYFDMESIEVARQSSIDGLRLANGVYDYKGTTTEYVVPSDEVKGGIPVTVYNPSNCADDPLILVWFHGGGFTVGCREGYDIMCKIISNRAGCIIVNVEYRLGPEHKTPAWFNDSCTTVKWVQQNKKTIGGSRSSKVGVSGDSAGGTIAACTGYAVPGIEFQVLVYPHLDHRCLLPSYTEYADDHLLTMKLIRWFHSNYVSEEDKINPVYNPLQQTEFSHVPPTLFVVAECDPLRDDSYEYAKKLDAAGVANETIFRNGVLHGYVQSPGIYPENCDATYEGITTFLKKIK